jgi:hypothetical protein
MIGGYFACESRPEAAGQFFARLAAPKRVVVPHRPKPPAYSKNAIAKRVFTRSARYLYQARTIDIIGIFLMHIFDAPRRYDLWLPLRLDRRPRLTNQMACLRG